MRDGKRALLPRLGAGAMAIYQMVREGVVEPAPTCCRMDRHW